MRKLYIIFRMIAFIAVSLLLICFLQNRLIPHHDLYSSQFKTFYDTPRNSIDVLVVGTSTVMVGVSPLKIYDETGILAHNRGGSTQPAEIMYYHIKESLNYQNPKIVICSVRSLFWEKEKTIDEVEASVRNGMDYTPLSLAKLEAAYNISKESEWQTMLSFVCPIIKYHNTWTSMSLFKKDIQYDYLHGQNAIYMEKSFNEDPRNSYNSTIESKISNNSLY